jgi:hypothetical protein
MRLRTLAALLAAVLLAWPASAQEQRGSIEGIVKDTSGAVLPGVTVTLQSNMGVKLDAISDGSGVYRFPSLLPGTYTVTANLQGFGPGKVSDVLVALGQVKKVDFALALAGVTETVQVTVESPLVDVKQSARATNIRAEQVELLPHNRDFTSLATQAPGSNIEPKSGGLMIDGAAAAENRYIIDGMETTDLIHGQSGKNVLADFVEEVQVKSSGYPAEYGGSTGGVINVLTKSGSNEFHGNALTYWQGSKVQGAPIPTLRLALADNTKAEYQRYAKDDTNRYEPGAAIGGPIFRNRMWFFGAYQPAYTKIQRPVTSGTAGQTGTSGNPNATPSNTTQKQQVEYITANQTMQLGSKLRTRLAFNNSWSKSDGQLAAVNGTDSPTTIYTKGTKFPNWSLSGTADYVVGPKFFLGFRAGRFVSDVHDFNVQDVVRFVFLTSNLGQAGVSQDLQHPVNFANVPNNNGTIRDQTFRNFVQADATYYARAGGDHQIKGGVQIDRRGNDVLSGELQNRINITWTSTGEGCPTGFGQFGCYSLRSNGVSPRQGFVTQGNVKSNVYGIFVQDAWTLNNKLTINAGIRTESENVPAYTTAEGVASSPIKFGMGDKVAPRAGFSYDVNGDGRWKAYGSWGVFYDIFKLQLPRGSFGGDKWLEYFYTLDTPNFTTLRDSPNCPPACPGTLVDGPIDFRAVSVTPGLDVEPNLKPMRSQEMTFGLEHQLNNVSAVTARFVHKQLDRGIDDVGDLDPATGAEFYIIANPGEGLTEKFDISSGASLFSPQGATNLTQTTPKASRSYNALELGYTKRLANNWSLYTTYTVSRDAGNYPGLSQSDENGRSDPNVGRSFDYPAMSFDGKGNPIDGPLPTDRTHQVKAQAIYQLPWGTSIGANEYLASGIPISSSVSIIANHNYPIYWKGRGDAGRTPMFSQTDLFVQHSFRIGGGRSLQLQATVLNLFNAMNVTDRANSIRRTGAIPLSSAFYNEAAFYNHQLDFDALINSAIAAGRMSRDPRYLLDSAYQAPIQARFGVRFAF